MAMELFLATYTVPNNAVGDYKLFVLLRGAHIKESPFVVHVIRVPVGWITCYKCGRRRSGYMKYYKNDNEPSRADDRRLAIVPCAIPIASIIHRLKISGP